MFLSGAAMSDVLDSRHIAAGRPKPNQQGYISLMCVLQKPNAQCRLNTKLRSFFTKQGDAIRIMLCVRPTAYTACY
eukprot:3720761-Amphidinium_carterae.1